MADLQRVNEHGHAAAHDMDMADDLEAAGMGRMANILRHRAAESSAKHRDQQAQAAAWCEVGNALRRIGEADGGR